MYKAHMTRLGKLAKLISHLKFNVALARALVKKGTRFTPKAITINGRGLHSESLGIALYSK